MKGKAEESVRPPFGEIKMIVGGMSTGSSSKTKKTYLRVVQNVQLSGRTPRMEAGTPMECGAFEEVLPVIATRQEGQHG